MRKAIVLAGAIITLAGSAQAGEFRGSYWRQSSYWSRAQEYRLARIANRQKLEKSSAENAAIKAGQQQAGAKYDAAMSAATSNLQRGVANAVGSLCSSCR